MQAAITAPPQIIMAGTIRNRVSELAGKRKMQISDLSREAGVSYDTAKRFWNGDANGITWDTLAAFCEALGCSVGELFEYVPEDTSKNRGR